MIGILMLFIVINAALGVAFWALHELATRVSNLLERLFPGWW